MDCVAGTLILTEIGESFEQDEICDRIASKITADALKKLRPDCLEKSQERRWKYAGI